MTVQEATKILEKHFKAMDKYFLVHYPLKEAADVFLDYIKNSPDLSSAYLSGLAKGKECSEEKRKNDVLNAYFNGWKEGKKESK